MIEINGVAHVILTVNDFESSKLFYRKLLPFLGLKEAFDGKSTLYFVGGKTAIGIHPSDEQFKHDTYNQRRVGLHHVCFRVRNKEDIDTLYDFLKKENVKIVHPPEQGPWAPGYYSVLFEDPDGIRLEANYVPGKGIFGDGAKFNPGDDYN